MKLDFKWDWKVILESEPNDVTLYIALLGIEHNILIVESTRNIIVLLGYVSHVWGINLGWMMKSSPIFLELI